MSQASGSDGIPPAAPDSAEAAPDSAEAAPDSAEAPDSAAAPAQAPPPMPRFSPAYDFTEEEEAEAAQGKAPIPFEQLPPADRYKLALSSLLDGTVLLCFHKRGSAARRLGRLLTLRHLRSLGREGLLYPISKDSRTPEQAHLATEQARHYAMREYPILGQLLLDTVWDVLLQFAPVMRPDVPLTTARGLKGVFIDAALEATGLKLGEGHRTRALRQLQALGAVDESTAKRWRIKDPCAYVRSVAAEKLHQRRTFLSLLDRVVVQRFTGAPSAFWMMGFRATEQQRYSLFQRMNAGAQAWLESHAVSLADIERGGEADLVWVQTGVALVPERQPKRQGVLTEALAEELEVTVLAAVQARLGLSEDGADFMRRAVIDREVQYLALETQRRAEQKAQGLKPTGGPPKGLQLDWETRAHWKTLPSFETSELDFRLSRGKLPLVMVRVHSLLNEVWPRALSVYEIYEHAQIGWPEEQCNIPLIEAACARLQAFHEIAENSVWVKIQSGILPDPKRKTQAGAQAATKEEGRWVRGFKSLKTQFVPPKLTKDYRERLNIRLRELFEQLGEVEIDTPLISSSRYILRRVDVPAYLTRLRALRDDDWALIGAMPDLEEDSGRDCVLCTAVGLEPLRGFFYDSG